MIIATISGGHKLPGERQTSSSLPQYSQSLLLAGTIWLVRTAG